MREASYYNKLNDRNIECYLCPHNCKISEGRRGICGVRKNFNGTLISEVYGLPVAIHTDPIEKKPLYHFYPGRQILSIGTVGCNMSCFYCQNCNISQATVDNFGKVREVGVSELVHLADATTTNIGVAFTYNEPTIFFEYMFDIAKETKRLKMKNIVVTNGFISESPLKDLMPYIDAFNVDLKAFSDEFYKVYTRSRLNPVLDSIKMIADAGVHLEITNLVIPNLNDDPDDFEKLTEWIASNTGQDTPLHLSRYYPRYKAKEPETSVSILKAFKEIAGKHLNYVYLGNVQDPYAANTYCKNCHETVIERLGYYTSTGGLTSEGNCIHCGTRLINHI